MQEPTSTSQNIKLSLELTQNTKMYTPPSILYELELETRAGTPLAPVGIDPLGINDPLKSP